MTSQEVIQTINAVSTLNPDDMDVQDQLKFFLQHFNSQII